jgi:hypothetical protein
MKNHHHGNPIHPAAAKAPTHEDIARRAQELWSEYGQPQSQDEAIWLEAEGQLLSGKVKAPASLALPISF